jgi:hypothetical protein
MRGQSERCAPGTNRTISVRLGVREGGVSSCRVNPARQAKGCAAPTAFRASRLRPENVAAHILAVEHDHVGELQWCAVMAVASFTVDPDPRCLRSEIAEAGDRAWSGFRAASHAERGLCRDRGQSPFSDYLRRCSVRVDEAASGRSQRKIRGLTLDRCCKSCPCWLLQPVEWFPFPRSRGKQPSRCLVRTVGRLRDQILRR